MPLILSLDIATVTGFATYKNGAALSTIRSGAIRAEGKTAEDKAGSIALSVDFLLRQIKPDFVALREPMRIPPAFTKTEDNLIGQTHTTMFSPNILQGSIMTGAVIAILSTFQLPFMVMAPTTYRKHFLGYCRKTGFQKADWQKAAADKARALKIPIKSIAPSEAIALALATTASAQFKLFLRDCSQ